MNGNFGDPVLALSIIFFTVAILHYIKPLYAFLVWLGGYSLTTFLTHTLIIRQYAEEWIYASRNPLTIILLATVVSIVLGVLAKSMIDLITLGFSKLRNIRQPKNA